MNTYDPQSIEPKWQRVWADTKLYAAIDNDPTREKYYYLTEFPYPSGEGLHVGHVLSYTALDIMARHKRMQGFNVLYPMGWDAFGLPTENYAIKTKQSPQTVTKANTDRFRSQLQSLGMGFDWDREINTSDPNYYKWTQWIFLQLFKKGLAYQAELAINWCPFEKTGLANEEVVDGKHERCGTPVEKKLLTQWMLKITAYADRLAEDLKSVDYLDRIASQQVNWIGRSEGAEITWQLQGVAKTNNTFKRVVLLHGKNRTPAENWYPWFAEQSQAEGLKYEAPALGADDAPKLSDWTTKLADTNPDAETVLVGHSRGGMAILRWLEQAPAHVRVGRVVLVATNSSNSPDKAGGDFFSTQDYDYAKIKQHCANFVVIHSRDDTWVPFEAAEKIAHGLGVSVTSSNNQKHFTGTEAPEVFKAAVGTVGQSVAVYTTRPDTLMGATFLVVSPELADTWIKAGWEAGSASRTYIQTALKASELSRQEDTKTKTGVDTGLKAVHPLTGEPVPVWVADYVLGTYGTGAIMAVPAHDERDHEFAKAFNLPIQAVVEPVVGTPHGDDHEKEAIVAVVRNPKTKQVLILNWGPRQANWGGNLFIGGGVEPGETSLVEVAQREIAEETGYTDVKFIAQSNVRVHSYYFSNVKRRHDLAHMTPLLFELVSDARSAPALDEGEQDKFKVEWIDEAKVLNTVNDDGHALVYKLLHDGFSYSGYGPLINSGKYDGLQGTEAKHAIVKDLFDKGAGKASTKYRLRDWIFSRQHYWGEPIPIIHCPVDGIVAVPADELPVKLPEVASYEPTETGESPLAAITDWVNTTCPTCGGPAKRETDTMPNWAGSSWYWLRYMDPHNAKEFVSRSHLDFWKQVDLYNGGMEHTTLHLLYSRFWHKFLFDQGLVPTSEPFARRRSHGMILGPDGQKMSKSRGNVINPDHVVAKYGADTIRLYEMFMGPFDEVKAWSEDHLNGVSRFIYRVWTWAQEMQTTTVVLPGSVGYQDDIGAFTAEVDRMVHKTLKKVHEDIQGMHFNTAVSALMELVNFLTTARTKQLLGQQNAEALKLRTLRTLILMLAPFVPHLAEEVWQQFGDPSADGGSVHLAAWPSYDPTIIQDNIVTIIVQINGKLRANVAAPVDATEAELTELAKADPNVARHLGDQTVVKTIVVPRKIVNFVVKPA